MTKEEFIALGLTEEQAAKAAAASAEELKSFIPKARFDEVNTAKKAAEKDVADRDTQLEELKKSSGDAAELTKKIESLQTENKAAKEKYETEAAALKLSTAVKLALAGKVHDPDDVTRLLDTTKSSWTSTEVLRLDWTTKSKPCRPARLICLFQRTRAEVSSSFEAPTLLRVAVPGGAVAAAAKTKLLNLVSRSPNMPKPMLRRLMHKNPILEADINEQVCNNDLRK